MKERGRDERERVLENWGEKFQNPGPLYALAYRPVLKNFQDWGTILGFIKKDPKNLKIDNKMKAAARETRESKVKDLVKTIIRGQNRYLDLKD